MARPKKLPAGMQMRGNVYYACFRRNGRLIRKRLSSDLEAAKVCLSDLRARVDRNDFGILDNNYPWDELKAEFIRWAKQSVRNPEQYQRDLGLFEEYGRITSIGQVNHAYVLGFREWRLRQKVRRTERFVTPRTVNREVGTLNNMLTHGVKWGRLGVNPIADLKPLRHDSPSKVRRALTVAEIEALFKASPPWLQIVLRMFATTGIRRAELVELRFSDVDFERQCVIIRADIAKNHRAREIPLDDEMFAAIAELAAKAKDRQPIEGKTPAGSFSREHVFVSGYNTPLRNNLLRSFHWACGKAGIEGAEPGGSVDIHSLRVTFATLTLENGASPKAVQAILGHSTLAMTMGVYAKATERAKRDAVGVLPFAKVTTPDHVLPVPNVRTECASDKTKSQSVAK